MIYLFFCRVKLMKKSEDGRTKDGRLKDVRISRQQDFRTTD